MTSKQLIRGKHSKGSVIGRRKEILHILNQDNQVSVEKLSQELGVSEVTIRNDFEWLSRKNMMTRIRGGGIKLKSGVDIYKRLADEKDKLNFQEKARIGALAASLVNESDTIIIDSGSTTEEMVHNLPDFKDLTIISNSLNITTQLMSNPRINLIVPGGYLRKNSQSLVGPYAEKNLMKFNVDKAFLGVDGFDTRKGIYTPNVEEARLDEIIIEISKEVILLVDSSKFSKRSLAFICSIDKVDKVITDNKISEEDRKRLIAAGVEVLIA